MIRPKKVGHVVLEEKRKRYPHAKRVSQHFAGNSSARLLGGDEAAQEKTRRTLWLT